MIRVSILIVVACLVQSFASAQDLKDLRPWIPEDINAVTVVRVGELMKSARAQKEGWQHPGNENFLGGAFTLPPDCELFVRSTRFHPSKGDSWSAGVLTFSRAVDMQRVATQEQSTVQNVFRHPAVMSRRNCFFAQLGPKLLGVISPAYRQDLARWIERGEQKRDSTLNRYIDEVLLGQGAGITMAIDLTEMFDPERLRSRLATFDALQSRPGDLDRLATRIQALRGLRLDVFVAEDTSAALTLDLSGPVGSDGPILKAILLEALGRLGASLDSFEGAEAKADGNSMRLAATFTDEDLRRVMTLVLMPHPSEQPPPPSAEIVTTPPPANTPPPTAKPVAPPRVVADNNVRYFRSVDQVLNDLQKSMRIAKDYARTATWHDNFANKIDQLNTLGVDPDLVAYGSSVSAKLRSLAQSLRGVAVDINALNSSVVYNYNYDPGWEQVGWWTYGYQAPSWQVTSNLADVRAKQADSVMAGSKDRDTIWQMIDRDRNQVLSAMTQKYGNAFADAIRKK